jgi:hypothetical protein
MAAGRAAGSAAKAASGYRGSLAAPFAAGDLNNRNRLETLGENGAECLFYPSPTGSSPF